MSRKRPVRETSSSGKMLQMEFARAVCCCCFCPTHLHLALPPLGGPVGISPRSLAPEN